MRSIEVDSSPHRYIPRSPNFLTGPKRTQPSNRLESTVGVPHCELRAPVAPQRGTCRGQILLPARCGKPGSDGCTRGGFHVSRWLVDVSTPQVRLKAPASRNLIQGLSTALGNPT